MSKIFYSSLISEGVRLDKVLVGAFLNLEGKEIFVNHNMILSNKSIASHLTNLGIDVKLTVAEGIKVPYIIDDNVDATKGAIQNLSIGAFCNCTALMEKINAYIAKGVDPEKAITAYANNIATNEGYSKLFNGADGFTKVSNAYMDVKEYLKGEETYKIGLPMTMFDSGKFGEVQALVNSINSKSKDELSFVSADINKSIKQESPEDQLFVEIPSYFSIRNAEDISMLRPNINEVFQPYERPELRTIFWRRHLNGLPEKYVLGDSANDDLPIQDNEKEFFNALCELIDYGIKQKYPDKDLEECKKNGAVNVDVQDYLLMLVETALACNWSHTGYIPVNLGMGDIEEDADALEESVGDGDKVDESVLSSKVYQSADGRHGELFDATDVIGDMLKRLTATDVYVCAEAIVKLFRWGSRKPAKLKLECSPYYIDLNTFESSEFGGSMDDLEVKLIDNKPYVLMGVVNLDTPFADAQYLREKGLMRNRTNVPVGLILLKSYVNGQQQFIYMSILDYINEYIKNDKQSPVFGLDFEAGTGFVVDDFEIPVDGEKMYPWENVISLDRVRAMTSNSRDNKYMEYVGDNFKEVFMSYKVKIDTSVLGIIDRLANDGNITNSIAVHQFFGKEEFSEKSVTCLLKPSTMLEYAMGDVILPVVVKVLSYIQLLKTNNPGVDINLDKVLNLYARSMNDCGFSGNFSFLLDGAKEEAKTVAETTSSNAVKEMNMFGSNEKKEETPAKVEEQSSIPLAFRKQAETKTEIKPEVAQSATPVTQPTVQPVEEEIIEEDTEVDLEEEVAVKADNSDFVAKFFSSTKHEVNANTLYIFDKDSEEYDKFPNTFIRKIKTRENEIVTYRFLAILYREGSNKIIAKPQDGLKLAKVPLTDIIPALLSSLMQYSDNNTMSMQFDSKETLAYMKDLLFAHSRASSKRK